MSTVVKRLVLKRNEKEYTEDIIKLSNYYKFKIVTCNVRSGWEKGSVENAGKIIRNDLYSLNYEFSTESDLFNYTKKSVEQFNSKIKDIFIKEKVSLIEKPQHDYLIFTSSVNKVNSYSTIRTGNVYYSVPEKNVSKKVIVHDYIEQVLIYSLKDELLATHIKEDGLEYVIDIEHYINTFKKKPGALKNSTALKQSGLKNIFNSSYNNNSKKFLEDLFGETKKTDELVETRCKDQLLETNNLLCKGVNKHEQDRNFS